MPVGIYPRTEEHKRKISLSLTGRILTEEHKKAVSDGTRRAMAALSLEKRTKMSSVHIGKKLSLEHRIKISKALKGNLNVSLAQKKRFQKESPWNKGTKGICKANNGTYRKGNIPYMSGKKHSFETKQKIREELKGNQSNLWKGGISKVIYPFDFSNALRELIRQRDGYKCQMCGCPQMECKWKLSVHHIDYDKKNCNPDNLISLCTRCHNQTNVFKREYWIDYFKTKGR